MWEPWPRTMYSGSPPTLQKARTGEFTPPGINCSARFCNLRDCSVLRVMIPNTSSGVQDARCGAHHMEMGRRAQVRPEVGRLDCRGQNPRALTLISTI